MKSVPSSFILVARLHEIQKQPPTTNNFQELPVTAYESIRIADAEVEIVCMELSNHKYF